LVVKSRVKGQYEELTFPFAHSGCILDPHRLGINIYILEYGREPLNVYWTKITEQLFSVIKVDLKNGEVVFGDFGGTRREIFRLVTGHSSSLPLWRLALLYYQQIDCTNLPTLRSLKQIELLRTRVLNGSLRMLLKGMLNLETLLLVPHELVRISLSQLPLNLTHFVLHEWVGVGAPGID
jgi:hypothetical protein